MIQPNDFSKFLLIFFYSSILVKRIWRWTNQVYIFLTEINPHYREQQTKDLWHILFGKIFCKYIF